MVSQLGVLLVKWRTRRGLTQQDLATLVEVTKTTIYRWEHGLIREPRIVDFIKALDALGITPQERSEAFALILASRDRKAPTLAAGEHDPLIRDLLDYYPCPGNLWHTMRQRSKKTVEYVAGVIGVMPSTVWRWEQSAGPPSQHREALFTLYTATSDEIAVLSSLPRRSNNLPMPGISLDLCAERLTLLQQVVDADTALSGDLHFLALEAFLLPFAQENVSARELLRQTSFWHAEWLLRRGRFREMGIYAERAVELTPAEHTYKHDPLLAVDIIAKSLVEGSGSLKPRRGIEYLTPWIPVAEELGEHTHMLIGMARYTCLSQEFAMAQNIINEALRAAPLSHCPRTPHVTSKAKAEILLLSGEADMAVRALPPFFEEAPHQQTHDVLLRARVFHAVGSQSEAEEWLARAYSLIDTHDMAHLRAGADRIAARW